MAVALGGVSGKDGPPVSGEDYALPNQHELTLDSTEWFLAAPDSQAGASCLAPDKTTLGRHLARFEWICGN